MIEKKELIHLLNKYKKDNKENIEDLENFLSKNENIFFSDNLSGHITCSAWVLDNSEENALLINHKKLNRLLQPGGHIEKEDSSLLAASIREAKEETGIDISGYEKDIFDIDIHTIPEKNGIPEHTHYDIRFKIKTKNKLVKIQEKEITGFEWVNLKDTLNNTNDESLKRMIKKTLSKTNNIKNKIKP